MALGLEPRRVLLVVLACNLSFDNSQLLVDRNFKPSITRRNEFRVQERMRRRDGLPFPGDGLNIASCR